MVNNVKRHGKRTRNNQIAEGKVTIKADEMIDIDNDQKAIDE